MYLYTLDPYGSLWREWDTAAFNLPADFLRSLHVCLPLFIDDDDSLRPFLDRICTSVGIKKLLELAMPDNVFLEAIYIGFAASWKPTIKPPAYQPYYLH